MEKRKNEYYSHGTGKSNIELLRIILMLLIVAHHYAVNSGLNEAFDLFY